MPSMRYLLLLLVFRWVARMKWKNTQQPHRIQLNNQKRNQIEERHGCDVYENEHFFFKNSALTCECLRAGCGNMVIFNTHQWWTVDASWSYLCNDSYRDHLLIRIHAVLPTLNAERNVNEGNTANTTTKCGNEEKQHTVETRRRRKNVHYVFHVFSPT